MRGSSIGGAVSVDEAQLRSGNTFYKVTSICAESEQTVWRRFSEFVTLRKQLVKMLTGAAAQKIQVGTILIMLTVSLFLAVYLPCFLPGWGAACTAWCRRWPSPSRRKPRSEPRATVPPSSSRGEESWTHGFAPSLPCMGKRISSEGFSIRTCWVKRCCSQHGCLRL